MMGDRLPYGCVFFFVGFCFQDLFNITRSILVQFPSSFFFRRFIGVETCLEEISSYFIGEIIYIYIYIYIYNIFKYRIG